MLSDANATVSIGNATKSAHHTYCTPPHCDQILKGNTLPYSFPVQYLKANVSWARSSNVQSETKEASFVTICRLLGCFLKLDDDEPPKRGQ